jgi:phosphotransferase system IIB component
MTLLGVFVPILINVTTSQELRAKQDNIEKFLPKLQSLEKYDIHLNSTSVKLINQNLQNSIGRLYFTGPELLAQRTYDSLNRFNRIIDSIRQALSDADQMNEHLVHDNKAFKNNLEDFIFFLHSNRTQFQVILNERMDVRVINDLAKSINELLGSKPENERSAYQETFNSLESFKQTIRMKIPKSDSLV